MPECLAGEDLQHPVLRPPYHLGKEISVQPAAGFSSDDIKLCHGGVNLDRTRKGGGARGKDFLI